MVNSLIGQNLPQKITNDNQIIEHEGYTLSYNETCEQANWVRYVIKQSDISCDTAERKTYFKKDPLVKTGSASHSDYSKSGYDRGHLKAAADESCDQDGMDETFYTSNISPQYPSMNRGIWKTLEMYTREQAYLNDSVIVITGGILDDSLNRIGKSDVCVPTNFFKVLYIFREGKKRTESYLIPNTSTKIPLENYKVRLEFIEEKSNLKFY
jgi:endonuclease G